ncbi:MAG: di-trans,poly-cis-decaprenylcistransferase [Tidjanibacter sp.]|nr:di-trans,poly-cis-decaprenylcistransferase [Tidjanibacter sp.]
MAENIKDKKTPCHVAIIMDGNGRWAQQRGLERPEGHIAGVEAVRRVLKAAVAEGVKYLTLYTFSTENWGRPKEEVDAIMELFCKSVVAETPELKAQGVRARIMGDRSALSEKVNHYIDRIENETAEGERITLIFAMNYSSRHELTETMKVLAQKVAEGSLRAEEIDAATISANLYSCDYPDPDLIIRTGGEYRLSNFLMWQAAYSELFFTPTLWPDFDHDSLKEALEAYSGRNRRFGLVEAK